MLLYVIVLFLGICFGMTLTNGEVTSWFRIQEMFRFDSFQMYGIIGSAIVVGALAMRLLKRFNVPTRGGGPIVIEQKEFGRGTIIGGILFGIGWALTGACPGPLFALTGNGYPSFAVALLSAVGGAFVYGLVGKKLPP